MGPNGLAALAVACNGLAAPEGAGINGLMDGVVAALLFTWTCL
jgi:hypothetical protein